MSSREEESRVAKLRSRRKNLGESLGSRGISVELEIS